MTSKYKNSQKKIVKLHVFESTFIFILVSITWYVQVFFFLLFFFFQFKFLNDPLKKNNS